MKHRVLCRHISNVRFLIQLIIKLHALFFCKLNLDSSPKYLEHLIFFKKERLIKFILLRSVLIAASEENYPSTKEIFKIQYLVLYFSYTPNLNQ